MLTCKETSFLASKKLDKKLTLKERINFSLHTAMCGLCRHYARDINALHKLMKKVTKRDDGLLAEQEQLSEQSRDRIKKAVDKALNPRD